MGTPPAITVAAGATTGNSSTFKPGLTAGTGYVYFSCSTNAPIASCAINTTDPLNPYVISSAANPAESVTVAVTTNGTGTTPGDYTVTVYAFTESNKGNGSNSTADASVAIPLTVN
jgi:hypothetical protein